MVRKDKDYQFDVSFDPPSDKWYLRITVDESDIVIERYFVTLGALVREIETFIIWE